MRALIGVLSLAAVATILQGCGGGSSACLNTAIDLVSQSVSGNVDGTVKVTTANYSSPMKVNAKITEKMDMEQWNFRLDQELPINMKMPDGTTLNAMFESKLIFNANAKMAVVWHRVTDKSTGKPPAVACTTKKSDQIPDPESLSSFYKTMVLPRIQEVAKCGGNDGTYDTWNMDVSADTRIIPTPVAVPPVNGSLNDKVEMDKDFLLHSMNGRFAVTVDIGGNQPMTVKANLREEVLHVSPGGPNKDDLDFSSWGNCTPSKEVDIDSLFQPSQGSQLPSVFHQISMGTSIFQKHILATLKASLESQKEAAVVV